MTKHTANHAAHIANQVSFGASFGYFTSALARLVKVKATATEDAALSAAVRHDIGEDDCRPAPRQSLKARQASQQRSLETMRMRSF